MMSKEEVQWLFKSLFDREIADDSLAAFAAAHKSFSDLRSTLLYSEEFYFIMKERLSDFSATYKACDYPTRSFNRSNKTSSICLSCIVKNGAKTIAKMLESALPIVDYVVIVDTGSTDGTLDIVCQTISDRVPLRVEKIEFVNFSQARNYALSLASGKSSWNLMLDSDEYLVIEDYANLDYMTSWDFGVDGWRLPRYNFLGDFLSKPYLYPDYQRRLFKNRPEVYFVNPVHEVIVGVNKWAFAPTSEIAYGGSCGGPHIHHTGLMDPAWAKEKYNFYESLRC